MCDGGDQAGAGVCGGTRVLLRPEGWHFLCFPGLQLLKNKKLTAGGRADCPFLN